MLTLKASEKRPKHIPPSQARGIRKNQFYYVNFPTSLGEEKKKATEAHTTNMFRMEADSASHVRGFVVNKISIRLLPNVLTLTNFSNKPPKISRSQRESRREEREDEEKLIRLGFIGTKSTERNVLKRFALLRYFLLCCTVRDIPNAKSLLFRRGAQLHALCPSGR